LHFDFVRSESKISLMPAEFVKIYPQNPDERRIRQVVDCLRDGGLVIYPTDTVYGLGCDIYNTRAVEKIARIKGIKPQKNDFSFICYDLSHISDFAKVGKYGIQGHEKGASGAVYLHSRSHQQCSQAFKYQ
jgi:tRNA threonylcarbamoyl adenosine modification protein (Sua5/YciO/YrdC/YwlC family)